MKMSGNDASKLRELSESPAGRLLWRYSLPAVVGMLVMSLYNIIDRIFIGQGVGPEAIAGLAITFPVMNLSAALGVLIGAGGSARLSILLGAKNYDDARRTLCSSLILLMAIVCCYLCCFAIFIDEILIAFGASEVTFNNFMRASGYPVKAMLTMLIGAGCNLVLAPIFIFYLKLGIKGAAIATDISMMISAFFVLSHFFSRKSTLHFSGSRELYRLKAKIVLPVLYIGAAPSVVNAAACFINVIINKSLYFHGGDMAVAAAGIFTSYTSMMTMVVVGICQGMQPIIGYNYGAGRLSGIYRSGIFK